MKKRYGVLLLFGIAVLISQSCCGQVPQVPQTSQAPQSLSLKEAEQIAAQNHPAIQAAQDLAFAAKQQVREVQSNYYPLANGSLTGVEAENNSRVTAGALNNPIIFDRYANGISVGQLVTDFGRTHELAKSSIFRAQAQDENVVTSRASVILAVDQAYFAVLRRGPRCRPASSSARTYSSALGNRCAGSFANPLSKMDRIATSTFSGTMGVCVMWLLSCCTMLGAENGSSPTSIR